MTEKLHILQLGLLLKDSFFQKCYKIYSRTSMAQTGFGPLKFVPAKGSSSHPGLVSV